KWPQRIAKSVITGIHFPPGFGYHSPSHFILQRSAPRRSFNSRGAKADFMHARLIRALQAAPPLLLAAGLCAGIPGAPASASPLAPSPAAAPLKNGAPLVVNRKRQPAALTDGKHYAAFLFIPSSWAV